MTVWTKVAFEAIRDVVCGSQAGDSDGLGGCRRTRTGTTEEVQRDTLFDTFILQLLHEALVAPAVRKALPFKQDDTPANLSQIWQSNVVPLSGRAYVDKDSLGIALKADIRISGAHVPGVALFWSLVR